MAAPIINTCLDIASHHFRRSVLTCFPAIRNLHMSPSHHRRHPLEEPTQWLKYNDVVYPPTQDGEDIRPVEVCHQRCNIKYSPKKMYYITALIRGLTIDEAIKQLSFYQRKGSEHVKQVLEEAQLMAVRDHNLEFKSNLWISDAKVGRGMVVKGLRKHRGPRYGIVQYRYCHVFVRLREGPPPQHYYAAPLSGWEKMDQYLAEKRRRTILLSL